MLFIVGLPVVLDCGNDAAAGRGPQCRAGFPAGHGRAIRPPSPRAGPARLSAKRSASRTRPTAGRHFPGRMPSSTRMRSNTRAGSSSAVACVEPRCGRREAARRGAEM